MSVAHVPVIGNWYSVLCPVCNSYVTYDCRSRSVYGIQCNVCRTVVDLRDPSVPLPSGDVGVLPDGSATVDYSSLVEESHGLSATEQLSLVKASFMEEQMKEMPANIGGETSQALMARRVQTMANKLSFMHPLVNAIEFVMFGSRPIGRVGNVRIFRPRLPLFGKRNIPVPQTSVSYAAPLAVTIFLFSCTTWVFWEIGTMWLLRMYLVETPIVISSIVLMLVTVYMDPGFMRPAYLAGGNTRGDILALKDIEANQRESIWETIEGQQFERKWCSTCEIHRPVRAAHCYYCGMCVMNHDHHCAVIGTCVGVRNAKIFTLYTLVTSFAALVPFLAIASELLSSDLSLTTTKFWLCIAIVIALGFVTVAVSGLSLSMCYNLMTDVTTRERLQRVYANKRNPFDRGVLQNLRHLFLVDKTPDIFDEEFVRLCAERV